MDCNLESMADYFDINKFPSLLFSFLFWSFPLIFISFFSEEQFGHCSVKLMETSWYEKIVNVL